MSDESTQPPVRTPNTPRKFLTQGWEWTVSKVGEYPDRALVLFLVLFGIAVIF